jgi:hypothetical protein
VLEAPAFNSAQQATLAALPPPAFVSRTFNPMPTGSPGTWDLVSEARASCTTRSWGV